MIGRERSLGAASCWETGRGECVGISVPKAVAGHSLPETTSGLAPSSYVVGESGPLYILFFLPFFPKSLYIKESPTENLMHSEN